MELFIGGYAQGKLAYVMQTHKEEALDVIEGDKEDLRKGRDGKRPVLSHFHLWFRKCLEEGSDPETKIQNWIQENPDSIIISDEIGNGIVPTEQKERDYRERLGRIQIELAKKAERVERIICGIGQRLK
ncbi:bifunctional adenosylcobinamide kinase/adenosylcobinamide-phosphate guanylyltransferase [Sellimonas sp.]|uniref:bifunctional adenosylcobinamide kinase/adenosylcobinamide-phosphate guanylyltransferase n=1 Tax=Sellimonas sp. TaxID=2021466 RepID=UPI00257E6431|nr:bifunctional adenosylcobinamide kinase/adenosylcobinamide-phosphate guanylyltransferase [Sellimonas sp.]